jgi:8-oxo-dGTP diphosphatase
MNARDTRYQAAVIESGPLLLLFPVPRGEAGFWVLSGGGREAGESPEECVTREVREEAGVEGSPCESRSRGASSMPLSSTR